MTDSELYEMLVNGIEPEGIEKVDDTEIEKYIEVLENILNNGVDKTPCQVRMQVENKINE